jgi:predicted Rdx family selenoprotein
VRDKLAKSGAEFDLQPGKSGQFDVTVDGRLAFSKHRVGRFPTDDEIAALLA